MRLTRTTDHGVREGAAFSPSDLNHFLECEHLIRLELAAGEAPLPARDAHGELLAAKGLEHERAWLEQFRRAGRRIVEIGSDRDRDWPRDAARTIAAMRDGADVIYQGVFVDGDWRGISDFLVRVEPPGAGLSGPAEYEAWDTKLARHSKPYFALQLCFYSEQIGRIQGRDPEQMHVILGTGEAEHFRYAHFAAYYRAVRRRFLAATQSGLPTYPYPVAHCGLCDHSRECEARWDADDHLSRIANITREQVQRLTDAGITTVAGFAAARRTELDGSSGPRVRIGAAALERLQHQARLQTHHRQTGRHVYELLPVDERSGFRLLPPPSPGDVFFDMEGDPYFEAAGGLEYLFGAVTEDTFTHFLALNRDEEKAAFERFIDWVRARLERWPDLHVYHYAAYEITALKRLMTTYATREEELDDLLRREVFVDLFQVVRQSLRISHASYSIKKVRTFFMEAAATTVADGADSILQFERYRATGDERLLQDIVDYNREDCVSTARLRDWLLERRAEAAARFATEIPWNAPGELRESARRDEQHARTAGRVAALGAAGGESRELLALLLQYHQREARPEWWAFFDRQKKGLDELVDDTQAIAWLEPVPDALPRPEDRSLVYTLRFPEQEYKLGPGSDVINPFTGRSPGSIAALDGAMRCLELKRGRKRTEPLPIAIAAGGPRDDAVQREALGRIADASAAGSTAYAAVRALLARERPRLRDGGVLSDPASLDASYLFVQGPPGSGKTWTGARMILSLIAAGNRVGVAAHTHKAINNLLAEVERVAAAGGVALHGLKKGSGGDALGGRFIRDTDDNDEVEGSRVPLVAGTGWLFSRPGMDQTLDYLFIDEAGQVSLADAAAMGTAARNLVLLGDPQQLAQVRHGTHPGGSGCSVLEHLLTVEAGSGQPAATVSPDRGLFLAQSWRMHPDICRFVSELSYDARLKSAPGRERQRIDSCGLSGAGLRYLAIEHTGNAQRSPEEAQVVAAEIARLLSTGTFTDHEGCTRPLRPADILVVAPFNMHVRCLRETLPAGVEVGTVDKFQGREAPVVFFSMASSSGEDVPRGIEFLFNRNRFNVAISRGRGLAVVVCSPRLLDARCVRVEQMPLVNMLCRFVEEAATPSAEAVR